jgi:hypothetical protein
MHQRTPMHWQPPLYKTKDDTGCGTATDQGTLVMGILGSPDRAGYQKIPANWFVDWQARHTSPSIDVLAISA